MLVTRVHCHSRIPDNDRLVFSNILRSAARYDKTTFISCVPLNAPETPNCVSVYAYNNRIENCYILLIFVESLYMNFISFEICCFILFLFFLFFFCYKYHTLYKSCLINQWDSHFCESFVNPFTIRTIHF